MQWFGYFLAAFFLSFVGTWLAIEWRERSEKFQLKRFGGAIVVCIFLFFVLFNPELEINGQIIGLVLGSFSILVFGLLDDAKKLSWRKQLIFQILLALVLVLSNYSIDYIIGPFGEMIRLDGWIINFGKLGFEFSFWGSLLILFWVICVINAVNWADGIDGLAGGIAMVGGIALLWISLLINVNQPAVAILALIFIGAVLGFWWFNFPFAKIELGTSGSYFVGFFLAATAIISGTKIATAMVVLALPVVDFFWVIFERTSQRRSPAKRDRNHLHYKLINLGWNSWTIVLAYVIFISGMLFLSFFSKTRLEKILVVFFEICVIVLFLYIISRKLLSAKNKKNERNKRKIIN